MLQAKPKKARGGARPGSGRKPGVATKRTREIADRCALEGKTPLEVLIEGMLAFRDAAKALPKADIEGRLKLMVGACSVAGQAAPYIHPRLQAIEHSGAIDTTYDAVLLAALQHPGP